MKAPKPIVTDTYDFPTLIKRGYVYVDKTALLHWMISGIDGTLFFMSRPRRFGKSLIIGVNYNPRKTGVEVVSEVVKSHPGMHALSPEMAIEDLKGRDHDPGVADGLTEEMLKP